ncbi:magnesium transporter NIPA-domain-containing protein [Lophiotrema nucula]|uniref:Magnesium transporter NIPA-domain-containing protein n=1 Tax=Lophiotrema nucula TaxID=690887 RepID=A0A6A5ZLK3_9PLEO|nr:magnesium transporter NIPA-domain-containing protein [Lophiotrema nucula]
MMEDKYIGLSLAISSSLAIGSSFVITKKGLNASAEKHGFDGDGFHYLRNPIWWAGMCTMVLGEIFNFAAYAFAPAILVTPLGALAVLIGAVLGSYFLEEHLGLLGKIGCATCLIGSVIIVLHAPPDEEVDSIDVLLDKALKPGFLFYCTFVAVFSVFMIYKVAPKHGRKNPLIYLSICSTTGSVSIMAIKAFGIALKMTFAGKNQFTYPSTYVFVIMIVGCILTQMNYFNKALSQFSTNIVNPLYYVTFTTCTLIASFLLFRGFNTTSAVNTISLLCGFLVIFSGVYLLNLSREDPDGRNALGNNFTDGPPTDGISGFRTRNSMQSRRSTESLRSPFIQANTSGTWGRARDSMGDRGRLMGDYDVEQQFELGDLAEDSDEGSNGGKRTSFDEETNANGDASGSVRVKKQTVRPHSKSIDR